MAIMLNSYSSAHDNPVGFILLESGAFFKKFPVLKNTIQTKANALDILKLGETDSVSTLDDDM